MAAVTATWYGLGLLAVQNGGIAYSTDTLKGALVTSSYVPNYDTDQYWSTPQANEASGTGYTAGGVTLASKTLTYSAGSVQVQFACANVSWSSSSVVAGFFVVYKSTGNAATSPLFGAVNFGGDMQTTNGTFTVQFDVTGMATITRS